MPKRTDIESILILGAGPIVIGQACEFDYSGTQACRALSEEGYRVILINSNPSTIMTDPSLCDATYVEPIDWPTVTEIIKVEKPDCLLCTMGGQTALNCALDLAQQGVLAEHGVQMIGANRESIDKAEDRAQFDQAMRAIGLATPHSILAHNMDDALAAVEQIGFPSIIRPSFTLGGAGGGIAYNRAEFTRICKNGFQRSPVHELLIDESLLGWKEYEMEVMRDCRDNCIIVCSIENLDPMGVHTGDSITVAPAQTLTDREYQEMRNAAIKVLREIGVDTGGSNVQFAVHPDDGRQVVIEMNPRVSRSSALASKATGFPIAKVAAKLAVGYTLDELYNDLTGNFIPASFEPTIDYVVTKCPRFAFDKFGQMEATLSTQMKSVGEVMGIGRNFQESLQKTLRSLENGCDGFNPHIDCDADDAQEIIRYRLRSQHAERLWAVADAFRCGMSIENVYNDCKINHWFLSQIKEIVDMENALSGKSISDVGVAELRTYKQMGFADSRLATLLHVDEATVRAHRHQLAIHPIYKRVDTCAAEFPATTAYLYSCYADECESAPSAHKKVVILGSGPNRIGQGIEFDYCCVHAALTCHQMDYETIMVNCNPETVSTDVDISDRLYFEPITLEDVLEIIRVEKPFGLIIQFGGQTPLKLAQALYQLDIPILGTTPDAIDRAENRERFRQLISDLNLKQPFNMTVHSAAQSIEAAQKIGYPLVVRPSYVLGGQAMEIAHNEKDLIEYMDRIVKVTNDSPVLLDKFLNAAIEVDIDAVCDGTDVLVGGIMQHIEQAGVHSGDSACSLPPYSLSMELQQEMIDMVCRLGIELNVIGLMNVQLAVQNDNIQVIEVNPRGSRTVPFVSKSIGVSLTAIAVRCILGESLAEQGMSHQRPPQYFYVKEAIFPFHKFEGVDPILGPEMKSTGEVMGIGDNFAAATAKALRAIGKTIPTSGTVLISVCDGDKVNSVPIAQRLITLGFQLVATKKTAAHLMAAGIEVRTINKVAEGQPHIVDAIINGDIHLIVNTTEGRTSIRDSATIRRSALDYKVYYTTTLAGADALCSVLEQGESLRVRSLQKLTAQF